LSAAGNVSTDSAFEEPPDVRCARFGLPENLVEAHALPAMFLAATAASRPKPTGSAR